ncbi:MAG TPA: Nudix family hydrolase [Burkholderiales bacterium]|nr:Nudix family hydrolase [Burkholderiales bacterium]
MIEVAAAVIQRPDGSFLLARRPTGKVYAGYWEFPGGKVEEGEQSEHALSRELHEELGIDVERAYPWITRVFTYPHGTVRLHFFKVLSWKNEPQPREEQAISWQRLDAAMVAPMLPANAPVLASLALPIEYAITDATKMGNAEQLSRLESRLKGGLKLLQVREPGMKDPAPFIKQVIGLAHRYGCKVMTKAPFPGADGVHFTASQLKDLREKPKGGLMAASCHTREELERAMKLELDFAVLGSVKDKSAIGWQRFKEIAAGSSIPVYAIGGLTRADLEAAWGAGAHGVAMIRGAWA